MCEDVITKLLTLNANLKSYFKKFKMQFAMSWSYKVSMNLTNYTITVNPSVSNISQILSQV